MSKPKVAFQGEKGAFSQVAIHQLLGTNVHVTPCQRFEEVFQSLTGSKVDAAVIPIENTLHGSVHENYDHLLNYDLRIVGETNVRVAHNLIARPGVKFKQLRKVYSHPVALNQCLKFLAANPQFERVPFYDTAGSVKMVIESGLEDAAGIASSMSAEIYGGEILKRNIEDDPSNFTQVLSAQTSWRAAPPRQRRVAHVAGFSHAEHSWSAVPLLKRVCAPGHQPYQD